MKIFECISSYRIIAFVRHHSGRRRRGGKRAAAAELLTRDGYTGVTASDGEEALELLNEVQCGWRRRDLVDAFIALGLDGIRLSTEPPGVSQ